MKKLLTYVFLVILLCFVIPIIFTNKRETISTAALGNNVENLNDLSTLEDLQQVLLEEYHYKDYNTIRLLHRNTGEVEDINLDEYLCGVLAAEMPASYELEALKSQAVVARSYTLYKIINSKPHGEEAHICDSYECCQAWISKEERFAKWQERNTK